MGRAASARRFFAGSPRPQIPRGLPETYRYHHWPRHMPRRANRIFSRWCDARVESIPFDLPASLPIREGESSHPARPTQEKSPGFRRVFQHFRGFRRSGSEGVGSRASSPKSMCSSVTRGRNPRDGAAPFLRTAGRDPFENPTPEAGASVRRTGLRRCFGPATGVRGWAWSAGPRSSSWWTGARRGPRCSRS